jgi:hypothetical protein
LVAAPVAISKTQIRVTTYQGETLVVTALVLTIQEAKADFPPPPPPPPPQASPVAGSSGIPVGVYVFFGIVIFLTILNPKKNSDSIFANTFHNQWKCQKPKDWRPRCN